MKSRRLRRLASLVRPILATLACLGLASCSEDYLARRDTLSAGSGDAVRADIAKQVIDPWPPNARLESLDVDGQRVGHAMELYRNPSSGVPTTGPAATSLGAAAVK